MITLFLLRKPLINNIINTIDQYGTSGININSSRVPLYDAKDQSQYNNNMDCHNRYSVKGEKIGAYEGGWRKSPESIENLGERFPSNFVIDSELFDPFTFRFFYKV
jgi:hypothetical protein